MPTEVPDIMEVIHQPNEKGRICVGAIEFRVLPDPEQRLRLMAKKIRDSLKRITAGSFVAQFPDKKPNDFFVRFVSPKDRTTAMDKKARRLAAKSGIQIDFKYRPEWGFRTPEERMADYDPSVPRAFEDPWSDEELAVLVSALKKQQAATETAHGDFLLDKIFMKAVNWVMPVAEKLAETNNFIFGMPFDARGKQGKPVPTYEGAPDNKKVNVAALRKARNAGGKLSSEFKYYIVAYTTMFEGLQPTIMVEGWKRGVKDGISWALDFRREKATRKYEAIGEPLLDERIPIDVFQSADKPKPRASKKAK